MIKCPINMLGTRPVSFLAIYAKEPVFHIDLKGKSKNPKLEEGKEYWIPEKYRIVDNCIQYFSDYFYKKKTPKWVEYPKMKEELSRYWISVKSAKVLNIQDVEKKHATRFGIPDKSFTFHGFETDDKPKSFKKSEELWRLKEYLNTIYSLDYDIWEDNSEIWLYEYILHRKKPKYPNYLDMHMFEVLK